MHKTPGAMPGVSDHGSDQRTPNPNRPILKASIAARLRLEALRFAERAVTP